MTILRCVLCSLFSVVYFFDGGGGGGLRTLPAVARCAAGTGWGTARGGADTVPTAAGAARGGGGGGRIDCGPDGIAIPGGASAAGAFFQSAGSARAASNPAKSTAKSGPRMPPPARGAADAPGTVGAATVHAAGFDRALR